MEYEDKEKLAKFITEDYPEIRMLINAGHYEEMWEYVFEMENPKNKANVFRLICALEELKINHGLTRIPEYYFVHNGGFYRQPLGEWPSTLRIPQCITEMGDGAFMNLTGVKEVIIPDNIKNEPNGIGKYCFGNGSYSKIKFPNNLKNIPAECCELSRELKSVKIPNSVEGIGESAFASTGLTSVTIPASVKKIHYRAFADTPLKKIVIPDTVEKIESGAFSECKDLKSITLPEKFRKSAGRMGFTKKQIETINWV